MKKSFGISYFFVIVKVFYLCQLGRRGREALEKINAFFLIQRYN